MYALVSRTLLVLLLTLASTASLFGQVPLSPRNLGMAGALLGGARGHEALFLNPANLGLPGNPYWSVAVPQVVLGGTMAGPALEDLPDFTRISGLSRERKDEILGAIPERGVELKFDMRAPLLTFQRRRLAFGIAFGATGYHTLDRDFAELALDGYEQGRIDYRTQGTAGRRMTYWDFAVGYGDQAGPIRWGVTAHYLRGGTLLHSRVTEPRVDIAAADIEVDYVSVLSRGGNGFALDMGGAFQPHRTVTLNAAVANAFATLSWSDELYIRNLHLTRADFDNLDVVALLDQHDRSERRLGAEDAALAGGIDARMLQDEAYLPTVARLGAAWQPTGWTQLGLAYHGRLTDGQLAGSWDRMLAVGIQQRIPLMTLRAGYATDLDQGRMLSGGISIMAFEIGVARLTDGQFDGAEREGWVGAIGLNIGTRTLMP
jgi:hypothetical protein